MPTLPLGGSCSSCANFGHQCSVPQPSSVSSCVKCEQSYVYSKRVVRIERIRAGGAPSTNLVRLTSQPLHTHLSTLKVFLQTPATLPGAFALAWVLTWQAEVPPPKTAPAIEGRELMNDCPSFPGLEQVHCRCPAGACSQVPRTPAGKTPQLPTVALHPPHPTSLTSLLPCQGFLGLPETVGCGCFVPTQSPPSHQCWALRVA